MADSFEEYQRVGRNTSVRFSLSTPSSAASSRSSSPTPSDDTPEAPRFINGTNGNAYNDKRLYGPNYEPSPLSKQAVYSSQEDLIPGRRPVDVYDATLPWWRAAIRRRLVQNVKAESKVIAKMQERIRTPWLDAYFVYTSSLGTHTFFMILLPAFFFFGYDEMGRGLLTVLALGVYVSSVVKDLICSPRPFAPPVTRLTIGSHHLEYGFPSTHSTNSISIALFFFAHVHLLATTPATLISTPTPHLTNSTLASESTLTHLLSSASVENLSPVISTRSYNILVIMLMVYSFSIVFGRLYTAMHSFTDCAMGILLGSGLWWGHTSWAGIPVILGASNPLSWAFTILKLGTPLETGQHIVQIGKGLGGGALLDAWVQQGGWEVPLILIPICLLLVNQHPQPVDDCPCFEDAIAFMSVVLGVLVGRWSMNYAGIGVGMGRTVVQPGSGLVLEIGQWVQVERGWDAVLIWWSFATLKMVVGILTIFVWRIFAKSTLHMILPPTFRLLARAFRLPHRRFYTPATEYKSVPSEFNTPNGFGLHPIPSVIDLPGSAGVGVEVGGIGSGVIGVSKIGGSEMKMRSVNGAGLLNPGAVPVTLKEIGTRSEKRLDYGVEEREDKDGETVKHYDADVLTKVIVYAGIAVLAAEVLPVMFEVLGWGARSWV